MAGRLLYDEALVALHVDGCSSMLYSVGILKAVVPEAEPFA